VILNGAMSDGTMPTPQGSQRYNRVAPIEATTAPLTATPPEVQRSVLGLGLLVSPQIMPSEAAVSVIVENSSATAPTAIEVAGPSTGTQTLPSEPAPHVVLDVDSRSASKANEAADSLAVATAAASDAPATGMTRSTSNYDLIEALADEDLDACCGICIESMGEEGEAREPVCTLPCGHKFHLACIQHWSSYEASPGNQENRRPEYCTCARCFTCPTCRGTFLTPPSDPVAETKTASLRRKKSLPTDMGSWEKLRRPYDGIVIYSAETCRCDYNILYSPRARYRCIGTFINTTCDLISACLWPFALVMLIVLIYQHQFKSGEHEEE